jgi:REP element-mobilizing transposase RayT
MPSKNSRKIYVEEHYYHVYNRGVEKRLIFLDEKDYIVFLNLLKRHLSERKEHDKYGRQYKSFYEDLELLAFCLMPNHFHLLFYLKTDVSALPNTMRLVSNAYANYFNQKYLRVGHLFQDRFKASMILRDDYLQHISRYIHLNPKDYKDYKWSSLPYYLGSRYSDWVRPNRILEIFGSINAYSKFVNDYEDHKATMEEVQYELANC